MPHTSALTAGEPVSTRAEFAATLRLAVPLAAANLLSMLVHAVDVMFVARIGERELAAASLSISVFGLIMWCFSGLTGAVAALVAAELGRRRHAVREVRRSARMALWMGVLSGCAGMAMCLAGERFMLATGQDPQVARLADGFLKVIMWALIPMILANVLRNVISALGRPVFATAITALSLGVAILGNYMFVFGHFGAPALGLQGSALASVITALFVFGAYVAVLFGDRRLRRYQLFGRWWRPEWRRLREILRLGGPIALTILAEAGLFSGAAFLVGRIGPAQLAGHTVALQIAALAFQIPFGIGQAATIRVGYFYGAGDRRGAGQAGWVAIVLGASFMLVTAAAIVVMPGLALSLYVDPADPTKAAMVGFAMQYLIVAAAFQLFDGTQAVAAGALRGLQDTRVPMWIAILGYWVPGIGTSIWLGFYTSLQGVGVWIGLAVGLVVVACLLLWRWHARERLALVPGV